MTCRSDYCYLEALYVAGVWMLLLQCVVSTGDNMISLIIGPFSASGGLCNAPMAISGAA